MRPLAAPAILAAALGVGACGHGDTPPPGPGNPPTKAIYLVQGDKICGAYNRAARPLQDQILTTRRTAGSGAPLTIYASALEQGAALARTASRDFAALTAPRGEEATVGEIRTLFARQADLLTRLAAAAAANARPTFQALNARLVDVNARERTLVRAYGFSECGTG